MYPHPFELFSLAPMAAVLNLRDVHPDFATEMCQHLPWRVLDILAEWSDEVEAIVDIETRERLAALLVPYTPRLSNVKRLFELLRRSDGYLSGAVPAMLLQAKHDEMFVCNPVPRLDVVVAHNMAHQLHMFFVELGYQPRDCVVEDPYRAVVSSVEEFVLTRGNRVSLLCIVFGGIF